MSGLWGSALCDSVVVDVGEGGMGNGSSVLVSNGPECDAVEARDLDEDGLEAERRVPWDVAARVPPLDRRVASRRPRSDVVELLTLVLRRPPGVVAGRDM
eukprot:gnl/Trimastix_PCT/4681.p3 GENE.gnl/Trimastix_PCT/4681~~gnl/Trimastix_PCT/4681.p3  ORF type:complete len:100 (-),score=14.39 gnl/Trimastix_PCT/4681:93-392(-)